MNLERRLKRIQEILSKRSTDLRDMSSDELAQIITGDPKAKASELTTEQLETIIREAKG